MNYRGFTTKTLRQFLARFKKQLAHKEKIIAQHEPGTVYHTRASREAETYHSRIARVEQELERRKDRWQPIS